MINSPIRHQLLSLLSLILLAATGCFCAWLFFSPPPPPPLHQHELGQATAITALKRAGFFHRFTQLLASSSTLEQTSLPVTIYAPTDDAMKKLTKQQWNRLVNNPNSCTWFLKSHLESGEITSSDITQSQWRPMMSDKKIPVLQQNGVLKLGEAQILKTDLRCADGLIHPVDRILVSTEQLKTN